MIRNVGPAVGLPFLVALCAAAASLAVLAHLAGATREVLAFTFLLVCPGYALLGVWKQKHNLQRLVLAVAVSVTVEAIVSEVMVYARIWSLDGAMLLLAAMTIGAASLDITREVFSLRRTSAETNVLE
ncbi:MAG TPA: hypothetical protein VFB58_08830 [Chloroflexota bacterium]|nr:hypothetical protein [Chloroflexota bacterium]